MRFMRVVSACGVAAWLFAGASAQPKAADPTPGTFRSFIVLDQRTDPKDPKGRRNVTGFQHDLIVANDLNPTVAVFARSAKPDESLNKLTAKLKELATTYKPLDFGAYLFFPVLDKTYTDDAKAKATADELKKWAEGVPVGPVVVGLGEKESDQTKAWKLPDTGVSIVFYHKHKVVKRWDLSADGLTDEVIAAVAAEVARELKK
ncbi:MAG: hypothetical protein MUF18_05260 [Fimbriiglobus sp.]|nr:hypothetical protein [Fimbriiglobus sp.]